MDLFWGEDFAGAGVAGGLEGGEEGFVAHSIFLIQRCSQAYQEWISWAKRLLAVSLLLSGK